MVCIQISNRIFWEILDLMEKAKRFRKLIKFNGTKRLGCACSRTSRKADLKTDAFIVRLYEFVYSVFLGRILEDMKNWWMCCSQFAGRINTERNNLLYVRPTFFVASLSVKRSRSRVIGCFSGAEQLSETQQLSERLLLLMYSSRSKMLIGWSKRIYQ